MSRLTSRIAALEAAIAPKRRVFLMWDEGWNPDFDGPPLEDRLAAFEIDRGVAPHDTVHIVSFLRHDDPEPQL